MNGGVITHIRPPQGRAACGRPFPGALPPATLSIPFGDSQNIHTSVFSNIGVHNDTIVPNRALAAGFIGITPEVKRSKTSRSLKRSKRTGHR